MILGNPLPDTGTLEQGGPSLSSRRPHGNALPISLLSIKFHRICLDPFLKTGKRFLH